STELPPLPGIAAGRCRASLADRLRQCRDVADGARHLAAARDCRAIGYGSQPQPFDQTTVDRRRDALFAGGRCGIAASHMDGRLDSSLSATGVWTARAGDGTGFQSARLYTGALSADRNLLWTR